jgi:hypothetical protein
VTPVYTEEAELVIRNVFDQEAEGTKGPDEENRGGYIAMVTTKCISGDHRL